MADETFRDKTKRINVGGVPLGGGAPIPVQSMTNTRTQDVTATVRQIHALEEAGCDIVRVAVPNMEAAKAISRIRERVHIPVVADIHFDHRLALEAAASGADKIRINPGNIGSEENVRAVAECCGEKNIPIRIGTNGGSIEKRLLDKYGKVTPEALVESALDQAKMLQRYGFNDLCVSLKASDVPMTVEASRIFARESDIPLHLGVTEAGTSFGGLIRSGMGIGALLLDGIGDTLRVSLTADPVEEVRAGIEILKSAGLRCGPRLISCPSCGRCGIDLIAAAGAVEEHLKGMEEDITVAVMGCVVNGPGEARHADYGLAGGEGSGVLFKKGEIVGRAPADELASRLINLIESERNS